MVKGQLVTKTPQDDRNCQPDGSQNEWSNYLSP